MIRKWLDRVRGKGSAEPAGREGPARTPAAPGSGAAAPPVQAYASDLADATQETPFMARLAERRQLTKLVEEYDEETIHLELEVGAGGESGLSLASWQAGDALAVIPTNAPEEVDAVVAGLRATGDEEVDLPEGKGRVSLREALYRYCDIKNLTPEFVEMLVNASTSPEERESVAAARADEPGYRDPRELQDVLRDFPSAVGALSGQQIVGMLKTIQPRLYSISSSPLTAPNRIALTVAVVRYELLGRPRTGLATTYLADRVQVGDQIPVFVQANPWFRVPAEDEGKSCVMISAGCGISAFRGFLQELEARAGNKGLASALDQSGGLPHVLFFGCRHEARDFLYPDELKAWEAKGLLRLFTAFSRDQDYKIYVQHRMAEQGEMLWQRMNEGHYFYVCGDATSMGNDVEDAMREIIRTHGGKNAEEASAYLIQMGDEGRFQKDVWTA